MSRVNSKIKIISATFYIKITLQGCLAIYELLTGMKLWRNMCREGKVGGMSWLKTGATRMIMNMISEVKQVNGQSLLKVTIIPRRTFLIKEYYCFSSYRLFDAFY